MELRNLGQSGLRVSAIGLGCNNFGIRLDLEATRSVVHKALDLGITLFDTADIYGGQGGSETFLGQVLGESRKNIVLATKFAKPMDNNEKRGGSRRYIISAVEASLKRLRTDWIDLYQMHETDPRTPIEETLSALDVLIQAGKIRYIGCSNFPAWEMVDAQWTSRQNGLNRFISCQDEYSLVARDAERDLIPAACAHGMGLLPYFPLANGLLTGKYKGGHLPQGSRLQTTQRHAEKYLTETNLAACDRLEEFATARGQTLLTMAFSWLLARPPVASVIAGATKPEQLEQNVKAGDWKLTHEDLAEIDRLIAG
jgi:aryl-alcohol dehydrogenase-like predicted oxidoreductase